MNGPKTTTPDSPPAVIVPPFPPATPLDDLVHRAAEYASQTSAASTRNAYAKDWAAFETWCRAMSLEPLPAAPATIGTYLTTLAGRLAVATLARRLAAIATAHRHAGHRLDTRHPAILDLLRGIRRVHGVRQRRAAPATTGVVQAMAATCDTSLIGLRDRALLLVGFAAALRRSEIAALDAGDVAIVPEGLRITVARSKTDQEALGETVGVVRTGTATCPVAAVQAWLAAAAITEGRVFRGINRHGRIGAGLTDQVVALIVKKRAALIGLDAAEFSGHSLRAGLATSAAANAVEERIIQRQTRHRSVTVLRGYIREGEVFNGNASGRVGL